MKSLPTRTVFLAFAGVIGLATLLSACGSQPELPSLSESPTSSSPGLQQVALDYLACMTAEGLPMELAPNLQGEMVMVVVNKGHDAVWVNPDHTMGFAGYEKSPELAEIAGRIGDGPGMVIDGVDHTTTFVACLNQTGYDETAAKGLVPLEPGYFDKQVEANNRWAECARDHGWPFIHDSAPPETGTVEAPAVVLPITITEDQLRQLLKDCPNFDAGQATKRLEWYQQTPVPTGPPPDLMPDPIIEIDQSTIAMPGGVPTAGWTPAPGQQDEMQRVDHLYEIIYEASAAFFREHPSTGPT